MRAVTPLLLRVIIPAALLAVASLHATPAGEATLQDCYARWTSNSLTVGNSRFERTWVLTTTGLESVGFRTKTPDRVWTVSAAPRPTATSNTSGLDVTATTGRRNVVESDSLRLTVKIAEPAGAEIAIQVFPGVASVILTQVAPVVAATVTDVTSAASTGVEAAPAAARGPERLGVAGLAFAPEHVRVTQVELADQTDDHDELVFERSWLLSAKERPFSTVGNILVIEDVLTGDGLVYLTLAPLPHARPMQRTRDFDVDPRRRTVRPVVDNYPLVTLAYSGGQAGRVALFQALQRQLRAYDPQRDGRFLSNTWGDRSRDARINEAFILQEIAAGARLGVDVIQIDDGWQKGRTSNSARGKGVWNGYWAADPQFWQPDPARFPNGLEPVIAAARAHGMGFGLWFGPDSSNDAANWNRDATRILELFRAGVGYVKIDSIKAPTATAAAHQRQFFDTVLDGSGGRLVFDLDVTAETRPGYFGVPHTGPVFVENRYTDFRSYWPHHTLRNLWRLAQYVDPLRLRIEFLNPERNAAKYGNDPLAPAHYAPDTLFAMTMVANPLGWFETSNLPERFVAEVAPLVKTWKAERARLHGGVTVPVGAAPDGVSWTGFVTQTGDGTHYVLLFRELNTSETFTLALPAVKPGARITVLGGRGHASLADGGVVVAVPKPLDFIWLRLD